jgi:hypothetical protein
VNVHDCAPREANESSIIVCVPALEDVSDVMRDETSIASLVCRSSNELPKMLLDWAKRPEIEHSAKDHVLHLPIRPDRLWAKRRRCRASAAGALGGLAGSGPGASLVI